MQQDDRILIQYLRHEEIDKKRWDDCLDRSVNGIIYARSWYLDIVSPGWQALVAGEYESVFPLTCRHKFFINYLYQPFFTQQLGLFTRNHLTASLVDRFLNAIPKHFQFARIHLNSMNKVDASRYLLMKRTNLELDLVGSWENLQKQMDQNTRRNIRKAAASGLKIAKGVDEDDLIKLFQENFGKKEDILRFRDYETLRKLISHCIRRGNGYTVGVKTQDDRLCAAVFFLKDKNRWIFHFAASDAEARTNGAMFLLVETFLKEHAGEPAILDFEGSNDLNVARFYKGFGASEVNYLQVTMNRLPAVLKALYYFMNRLRNSKKSIHL